MTNPIKKHVWWDEEINRSEVHSALNGNRLMVLELDHISSDTCGKINIGFNKQDAIAMAKALGGKPEDLE